MKTDVRRPIGYRSTEPFGTGEIPWRAWAGPLILARVPGVRFGWWSARGAGWDSPPAYSLTLLGLSLSWAFTLHPKTGHLGIWAFRGDDTDGGAR